MSDSQQEGPLDRTDLQRRIAFLERAERLKTTTRTAWKSDATRESVAEHSWRLCLMAIVFRDLIGPVDLSRLLQIIVVHDLGEAISGDVSAVLQENSPPKAEAERRDLQTLLAGLTAPQQKMFLDLWDEYEAANTREAVIAKGLDKLETILQHNQGRNPAEFDYEFNLGYARKHTDRMPLLAALRELLDEATRARVDSP